MPSGYPKSATPTEIAKYGHIAATLRDYMTKNHLTYPRLGELLGIKKASQLAPLYKWGGSKTAPGPMYRTKLAKLLGVKPEFLSGRKIDKLPVPLEAAQQLVPRKASADVLTFNVDSDGEARLRLDVKLPLEKGTALLRIVLDAGVLMSAPPEAQNA